MPEPGAALLARKLFPAGVALAWRDAPADETPGPTEFLAARHMADGRRQHFHQGRQCARASLRRLGIGAPDIPIGEQRAPIWPAGVCGSIAHCNGRAIAVSARHEVAAGLGVDLEEPGPLEPGVIKLICTAGERLWLEAAGKADQARLLFAIKESIYKCLWPQVRRFIDFQEVEVEIDAASTSYRAHARNAALDPKVVASIRGGFATIDDLLLTSAYLPPAPVR